MKYIRETRADAILELHQIILYHVNAFTADQWSSKTVMSWIRNTEAHRDGGVRSTCCGKVINALRSSTKVFQAVKSISMAESSGGLLVSQPGERIGDAAGSEFQFDQLAPRRALIPQLPVLQAAPRPRNFSSQYSWSSWGCCWFRSLEIPPEFAPTGNGLTPAVRFIRV